MVEKTKQYHPAAKCKKEINNRSKHAACHKGKESKGWGGEPKRSHLHSLPTHHAVSQTGRKLPLTKKARPANKSLLRKLIYVLGINLSDLRNEINP